MTTNKKNRTKRSKKDILPERIHLKLKNVRSTTFILWLIQSFGVFSLEKSVKVHWSDFVNIQKSNQPFLAIVRYILYIKLILWLIQPFVSLWCESTSENSIFVVFVIDLR